MSSFVNFLNPSTSNSMMIPQKMSDEHPPKPILMIPLKIDLTPF